MAFLITPPRSHRHTTEARFLFETSLGLLLRDVGGFRVGYCPGVSEEEIYTLASSGRVA